MIYIDPPYNTGKDFVYKDNYNDNLSNYLQITGQADADGKRLSTNTESDGRYHSNWLNMMYPRLKLARNLLKDDGVIFISIDNKEVFNLRKLCDEIFGEENFVECITWNKRVPKNDKGIGNIHEYIVIYALKHSTQLEFTMKKDGLEDIDDLVKKLQKSKVDFNQAEDEIQKLYKKKGYDRGITLYNNLDKEYRLFGKINMSWPNSDTFGSRYVVEHPITKKPVKIPERGWRWKDDTFKSAAKIIDDKYSEIIELYDGSYICGRIWFGKNENIQPSSINYLDEVDTFLLRSILSVKSDGGIEVENLFEGKSFFSYPKSTSLIEILIDSIKIQENDIILDFFAGSGTTAHAAMQLNADDGGDRKFICVQLPEPTDESSEAFKAGYKTIAQITKERIRRAGEKVKAETKEDLFKKQGKTLDIGFKAFTLDSSNIRTWDSNPANLSDNLFNLVSNIKQDRTEEDILFEVLLKYGLDLTVAIEEKQVNSQTIYSIAGGVLLVCVGSQITTAIATAIGTWKEVLNPTTCRVLFSDNGFANDVEKTNSIQILKRFGINEINSL